MKLSMMWFLSLVGNANDNDNGNDVRILAIFMNFASTASANNDDFDDIFYFAITLCNNCVKFINKLKLECLFIYNK